VTHRRDKQVHCVDPECNGDHEPTERVRVAASLCSARGVNLTEVRRQILELLWEHGGPAGAYDLIEALNRLTARKVAPPTVYRALEFLVSQGLVARLESQSAYVPCAHPNRGNALLFLICTDCGQSFEMENSRIDRLLSQSAAQAGFTPVRRIVEVEGTCARCNEASSA
jgi:Fur family transcriptional regulator, zinc uptake regulator